MKFHKTINIYLIYLTAFALILGNTALSMASSEVETMSLSFESEGYVEEEVEIDLENILRKIEEEEEEELSKEDLNKLD